MTQISGHDLKWSQADAGSTEYELRSGGELVATLKVKSVFGTLATAESGGRCWTFKRVGFWHLRVTIRACGSDEDLAVFSQSTWDSGGILEFPDGRKFKATTSLWRSNFEFRTEADQPLVRFTFGGAFRRSADVEMTPLAESLPDAPLLVLFGWYLIVMLSAEAELEAGAVTALM